MLQGHGFTIPGAEHVGLIARCREASWQTLGFTKTELSLLMVFRQIATVEGTERNVAQWLSDAFKISVMNIETRTVIDQEMATMAPNFEREYVYL